MKQRILTAVILAMLMLLPACSRPQKAAEAAPPEQVPVGQQIAIQKGNRPKQRVVGKSSGKLTMQQREPSPGHAAAGTGNPGHTPENAPHIQKQHHPRRQRPEEQHFSENRPSGTLLQARIPFP